MTAASPDVPLSRRSDRVAFSLLCAGLGVIVAGLGWLVPEPGTYDPLALRLALGGGFAALSLLPWGGEALRARAVEVARGAVPLTGLAVVLVATLNGFEGGYAAGVLVTLAASVAAGVLVYDGLLPLAIVLALLTAAAGAGLALGGTPPELGYVAALLATAAVSGLSGALHHRAARRGHESDARFRAIFDGAGDGVFLCDRRDFAFLDVNAAYLRIIGYTRAELLRMKLDEVVEASPADLAALAEQVNAKGEAIVRVSRHRRKGGLDAPFRLHVRPVKWAGRPALCVTAHDLTERLQSDRALRKAKEHAEEMLNLKGAFLANMSHELRTPLVGILGFSEILAEEVPDDLREGIGVIRRSAVRLQETLNSVLDLAQLEGGGVTLRPESVDVVAAADETAEMLRPMAEAKGIFLHTVCVNASQAWLDRGALNRVLTNLVTNAIKFTKAGGVTVEVATDSHRVIIRVQDTGIGIAPELVPQLFREFRQASQGMDRTHEGNGLGLAITKRLVDLLGGRIAVESTPGQGSTFTVAFARSFVAPGTGGKVRLSAEPRVLVVEDNADTARLMARTLSEHYEVTVAASADEAEKLAQQQWFDVLLLDIQLGRGRNGIELLHDLRRMSAYEFVPAIATSAGLGPQDIGNLLEVGFNGYLPKPFTRAGLLGAVDQARHAGAEQPQAK